MTWIIAHLLFATDFFLTNILQVYNIFYNLHKQ